MELKDKSAAELIERRSQIAVEVDTDGADLGALEEEVRAINAELAAREAAEEERKAKLDEVKNGLAPEIIKEKSEERKMNIEEIRNSKEYIDAFGEAVRTGDQNFKECRALISENGSGTVAVPTFVEDAIKTAWEREGITSRIRKVSVKGNLKVNFERSATAAAFHTEGGDAPDEETLVLGIVTLIPAMIKKWISFSDEAESLRGEAFLRYIMDEIADKLVNFAAATVVGEIAGAPTASTATAVGVPVVNADPAIDTVATALGQLTDAAVNPVVILNRATWSAFKAAQYAGSFNVDPFEGLTVLFTSALKAHSAASANEVYMIVGDLAGVTGNFPNGFTPSLIVDRLSLAEADLVKVVGKLYAGIGVTGPGMFVNVTKE